MRALAGADLAGPQAVEQLGQGIYPTDLAGLGAVVARILAGAAGYLRPGGIMVVEVGASAELLMARYPDVPFLWLDFERGGDGVFLLTAEQLDEFRDSFEENGV